MKRIVIVGGGPKPYIPDLKNFPYSDCIWIGADKGAEVLVEQGITPDLAIGDFDSVGEVSFERIKQQAEQLKVFPNEKAETDLELALREAILMNPEHIFFFGVTGGRIDHSQANLQLLYPLMKQQVKGTIIDQQNQVELVAAGEHTMEADEHYPYVSFLPVTLEVTELTLKGFYYPLDCCCVSYGSTRCLSNQLIEDTGTFSFASGILLVIRSKDLTNRG